MVDFKRAVVRALGTTGTGVLLDPEIGVAPAIADGSLPGRAGLIVAVEATGFEGPAGARVSRVLPGWGVEQVEAARRVRGQAARLLPPGRAQRRRPGAASSPMSPTACREHDLALFLEPLSFGLDGAQAHRARTAAAWSWRPLAA